MFFCLNNIHQNWNARFEENYFFHFDVQKWSSRWYKQKHDVDAYANKNPEFYTNAQAQDKCRKCRYQIFS